MVAVIAGDVAPILAGDIYCSVLEACQETFDLRRAYEWTTSLAQWCASQPDLVRYRGECLLYRAEVMQLRGNWDHAAQDAHDACGLLTSGEGRPMAGAAFYRLGEIHRLRGEFTKAEAAYARANERGRKPYPGLALLRLAQGQIDAAAVSIRGVLVDTRAPAARARVLAAAIEILLAARDLDNARAATGELTEIASRIGASLLHAASAHATGALLLAQGDIAGASTSLRQAWEIWRDLEMPYEEAQTCLLVAAVCEKRGDQDGRRLELETARRLFKQLSRRTLPRAHRRAIGARLASANRLAQRTRGAGTSAARRRQDESRHRRRALHQRKDCCPAREQHLRQAWRVEPYGRDRLGVPAQPHLSAYIEIPNFKASAILGIPSDVSASGLR